MNEECAEEPSRSIVIEHKEEGPSLNTKCERESYQCPNSPSAHPHLHLPAALHLILAVESTLDTSYERSGVSMVVAICVRLPEQYWS